MKQLKIIAGLLSVLSFVFTPFAESSRMGIKKMDYSASWRKYALNDTLKQPVNSYPFEDCFRRSAKKNNIPFTMLLAIARGESDFNAMAESSASCYGIMQIQWPGTAKDLGFKNVSELYNPCSNIEAGAEYIKKMIDRYNGDIHLALAAYNYGPGRIKKTMTASSIPRGASWYSGYIYYHLQQVLAGSDTTKISVLQRPHYKPGQKLPVILFHNPLRAMDFLEYFKKEAFDLRLDWFRTALGETYIVLLYNNEKEKKSGVEQLRKAGFYVDVNE